VPNWPDHVTGDEMVAAMGKIGVDGAIFISAFLCTSTTPATRWKCSRPIPTGSPSSSPVNPDDPAKARHDFPVMVRRPTPPARLNAWDELHREA
jgi:L-fuconolactonase